MATCSATLASISACIFSSISRVVGGLGGPATPAATVLGAVVAAFVVLGSGPTGAGGPTRVPVTPGCWGCAVGAPSDVAERGSVSSAPSLRCDGAATSLISTSVRGVDAAGEASLDTSRTALPAAATVLSAAVGRGVAAGGPPAASECGAVFPATPLSCGGAASSRGASSVPISTSAASPLSSCDGATVAWGTSVVRPAPAPALSWSIGVAAVSSLTSPSLSS